MRADVAQGHLDDEDELSDEPNDNSPDSQTDDAELLNSHRDDAGLRDAQPNTVVPASDLTIAQRSSLRRAQSRAITPAQTQLVHTFLCDEAYSSLIALQASQCGP